jgi:hypothetical protein
VFFLSPFRYTQGTKFLYGTINAMSKRGFAAIWIVLIIVVVLAAAGGGVWYYEAHKSSVNNSQSQSATTGQTTPTYQNANYGISFDYPNNWTVKSGNAAEGDYGLYTQYDPNAVSLITVEIPSSLYPGTNLEGAYFNLSVDKQLSQSQCSALNSQPGPNNIPGGTITIGGVTFNWYAAGGVAAGTDEFTENYSGYTNGICYEFNLGDTTGNDVSATGMKMLGSANDISALEGVFSSVKFGNPGSLDITSATTSVAAIPAPSDIIIPATSTNLVAIPQDPYGLFMAPANAAAASDPYYDYGFSGTYLNDGTIESGPYAGYDRVLFNDAVNCDVGGCEYVNILFATKDHQSFILDNDTVSQDSLNTLAHLGVYLDAAKIVDQSPIISVFRENIAANNVEFVNGDNYSTSSASNTMTSITSPVQGLSFFYNYNPLPGGATSSDFSAARNGYINTVNTYVAGLSSEVEAEDGAGITVSYTLSIFPPYGEDIFGGIASGTIFTSYGGEGCYQNDPWYVLKNVSDGDLLSVGTTKFGVQVYSLKDPNHPLNQAAYYSEVSSVQNFSAMNDTISAPSFNDFVAKHPMLIIKDPFGRLLAIDENEYTYADGSDCGGKKPVIYLYPQKPTKVAVQFAAPIDLTLSIPAYVNGWNMLAQPNGTLQDLQPQFTDCGAINSTTLGSEYAQSACEKNDYPYLYWAGYIGRSFPHLNEGWVVSQSDIRAFLEKELIVAGLNQKEKDDMISYWVPELSGFGAPYYRLSFLQTDQMNTLVPLNITPKPDTEFRIFLLWSPLTAMPSIQLQPEILQPLVRRGFTVVEWGGGEQS